MEISDIIENISCNCIKVQRKTFEKGSIITTYIEKRKQIWEGRRRKMARCNCKKTKWV